ncbi:hypothetical protein MG293_018087 [Ovis ammon polii]|uniref:Uncharacterized protein n=1 Tax=Ovis ammon polii TaxID=230172 RepID=A0AAD4TNT4_OVIAM|nr:hypothetical protein MG293_018087 [Ovis ammon polii]
MLKTDNHTARFSCAAWPLTRRFLFVLSPLNDPIRQRSSGICFEHLVASIPQGDEDDGALCIVYSFVDLRPLHATSACGTFLVTGVPRPQVQLITCQGPLFYDVKCDLYNKTRKLRRTQRTLRS